MNLSEEQKIFLKHHKIDERFIFDASGIRHKDYGNIMKNIGLFFAIGVTPCLKGGHTLRNRKGQCIQCDTSKIAFMLRSGKNAYIYVVGSLKGKVLKVGFAEDVNDRLEHLIGDKYGGLDDWKILYSGKYDNALKFENLIHNSLSEVHYNIEYNYYGKNIISNELFRCDFDRIKNIIDKNKSQFGKVESEYILGKGIENYNFIEESKKVLKNNIMKNKLKKCPYCDEDIQENAQKCKHCGEWLNEKDNTNELAKLKQSLLESENNAKAYANALDKLGEHEILGPLNEKLLKGEDLNLVKYLNKENQEELNNIDINLRNTGMRYIGILVGLRDNGYISIEEHNKQRGIIIGGIKEGSINNSNKYEELAKLVELKDSGDLDEDEFFIKLNKLLNVDKNLNNPLKFYLLNFLFSRKGKISRSQYILGLVFILYILSTLGRVIFFTGEFLQVDNSYIYNIYFDSAILFLFFILPILIIFYIFIIISIKRLHDLNKNGMWLLVPIYSVPVSIFLKGEYINEYNKKINKLLIFMIISFSVLGVILGILFPDIK